MSHLSGLSLFSCLFFTLGAVHAEGPKTRSNPPEPASVSTLEFLQAEEESETPKPKRGGSAKKKSTAEDASDPSDDPDNKGTPSKKSRSGAAKGNDPAKKLTPEERKRKALTRQVAAKLGGRPDGFFLFVTREVKPGSPPPPGQAADDGRPRFDEKIEYHLERTKESAAEAIVQFLSQDEPPPALPGQRKRPKASDYSAPPPQKPQREWKLLATFTSKQEKEANEALLNAQESLDPNAPRLRPGSDGERKPRQRGTKARS